MKRNLLAAFVAALILGVGPASAEGNSNCAAHNVVLERLADRFGESRQMIGLSANIAVLELFVNTETGSWTIAVTHPGGDTCLVASGEGAQMLAEALPNTDEGA